MTVIGWVEHQIRTAQRRGDFDNLPGAGQPIAGIKDSHDTMDWVAAKLRRENVDVAGLLPPSLALAKEVEELPERVAQLRSEHAVREYIEDLNKRIREAHRRPQEGPPMRTRSQDVEQILADWRARRCAP